MTKVPGPIDKRKCTQAEICAQQLADTAHPAAHPPLHGLGVVPEKPSFIAHISKAIGRKEFCYELRISKSLLDQWMSGEKKDPIERVRDILRVAAKCYGPDLPLDIAQELVEEFGGVVSLRRKARE